MEEGWETLDSQPSSCPAHPFTRVRGRVVLGSPYLGSCIVPVRCGAFSYAQDGDNHAAPHTRKLRPRGRRARRLVKDVPSGRCGASPARVRVPPTPGTGPPPPGPSRVFSWAGPRLRYLRLTTPGPGPYLAPVRHPGPQRRIISGEGITPPYGPGPSDRGGAAFCEFRAEGVLRSSPARGTARRRTRRGPGGWSRPSASRSKRLAT